MCVFRIPLRDLQNLNQVLSRNPENLRGPALRYVVVMVNACPSRPIRSRAGAMCVLFKLLKSARVFRPIKTSTKLSDGGRRVC